MQLQTLNLKKEIEKIIEKYFTQVKCANVDITYLHNNKWNNDIKTILKVNFTAEEYHKFMELVNVDIEELSDCGHHSQCVKVWFTDGSWLECTDVYSRMDEGAQAFYYRRFKIDEECL